MGDPRATSSTSWRKRAWEGVSGLALGRLTRFSAAVPLGFAAMLLTIAWQTGAQPVLDAAQYRHYTTRSEGTVAASWIALEFDTASDAPFWTLRARGTPCMTVNVAGDWGAPFQRAFCGARFPVEGGNLLHRLPALFTGAPFAWRRDQRGFAVPEIHLDSAARDWLTRHAPNESSTAVDPRNALDELRLALDEPVEQAIAGWSAPAPILALALDPRHPDDVVPAVFADAKLRAETQPAAAIFAAMMGLLLWFAGMATLMRGLPRAPRLFAAIVPLLALPWWGEEVPLGVARLDSHVAMVIASMLDGFENRERLRATTPEDAQLAAGERIVWSLDDSAYSNTVGSIRFLPPLPTPRNADAALRVLEETVAAQVRSFDAPTRRALFDRLRQDKQSDRRGAGLAFLDAARVTAREADTDAARAASGFLEAWTTPPYDLPAPEDPAFEERVALYRSLADVPDDNIANAGRAIAELADGAHSTPPSTAAGTR